MGSVEDYSWGRNATRGRDEVPSFGIRNLLGGDPGMERKFDVLFGESTFERNPNFGEGRRH